MARLGRVAVVDPLPLFRAGVAAALVQDGHVVDMPQDLPSWLRAAGPAVVLLTVRSAEDWMTLAEAAESPAAGMIVLLDDVDLDAAVRAVHAGALSVVDRSTGTDGVRRVCQAAFDGESVLPGTVVRALAALAPAPTGRRPTAEQLAWLRRLAAGSTVSRLAVEVGYSERAMFRLLKDLYRTIGVRTRTEALMRANERGWLR